MSILKYVIVAQGISKYVNILKVIYETKVDQVKPNLLNLTKGDKVGLNWTKWD